MYRKLYRTFSDFQASVGSLYCTTLKLYETCCWCCWRWQTTLTCTVSTLSRAAVSTASLMKWSRRLTLAWDDLSSNWWQTADCFRGFFGISSPPKWSARSGWMSCSPTNTASLLAAVYRSTSQKANVVTCNDPCLRLRRCLLGVPPYVFAAQECRSVSRLHVRHL